MRVKSPAADQARGIRGKRRLLEGVLSRMLIVPLGSSRMCWDGFTPEAKCVQAAPMLETLGRA